MKRYRLHIVDTSPAAELIVHLDGDIQVGQFIIFPHGQQILSVIKRVVEPGLITLHLRQPDTHILTSAAATRVARALTMPQSEKIIGILPDGTPTRLELNPAELYATCTRGRFQLDQMFWNISNPHNITLLYTLEPYAGTSLVSDSALTQAQVKYELKLAKKELKNFLSILRSKFMQGIAMTHWSKHQFTKALPGKFLDLLGTVPEMVGIPLVAVVWSKLLEIGKSKLRSEQIKKEQKLFKDNRVHPYEQMEEISQFSMSELVEDIALTYWQTMSVYATAIEATKDSESHREAFVQRQKFFKWYAAHEEAFEKIDLLKTILNDMHKDLKAMESTLEPKIHRYKLAKTSSAN